MLTLLKAGLTHTQLLHANNKQTLEIDVTRESFFRSLCIAIYQRNLQLLRTRSRVFVEKGRVMMGVLDEQRILPPNCVYACCSGPEYENYI